MSWGSPTASSSPPATGSTPSTPPPAKFCGPGPTPAPATKATAAACWPGDRVCWPTRTEIIVLDQATGGNEHTSIPLFQAFGRGGGNLAAADGYLVVAEKDALVAYCENSRLIDRYEELIVAEPERASYRYRLAKLAEAADRPDLALASFEAAAALAVPTDLIDGRPLAEAARDRRHGLLRKLGELASKEGRWAEAAEYFEAAAESARIDRDRLESRLALAEALEGADKPGESVAILQGLLADERLASLSVSADSRRTVRVDLLVTDRLNVLLAPPRPGALRALRTRRRRAP